MRLIDADKLTNIVFEVCNKRNMTMTTEFVIDVIRRMPTIVEVVRCKDCRHRNWETQGCNRNPCVEAWHETDFCSYGERRKKCG